MAQIAMKYGLNSLTNSEQMSVKPDLGIDWNHYNYPPCFKIFNYDRQHIPEDLRRLVFTLWFNHILIFIAVVFNFITNIVATATQYPQAWVQLVISVFLCILWTPLGLYLFYLPYMILLKNQGNKTWYYVISALTFVWFFIWSVANFADANGFVKIGDYFNSGYKVAGGFAVIESILCFGVSILTVLNAFLFSRK